jgi:hypothetical protein
LLAVTSVVHLHWSNYDATLVNAFELRGMTHASFTKMQNGVLLEYAWTTTTGRYDDTMNNNRRRLVRLNKNEPTNFKSPWTSSISLSVASTTDENGTNYGSVTPATISGDDTITSRKSTSGPERTFGNGTTVFPADVEGPG